ncbi:MAG: pyridoxal phosphate-dependent aminotransferase [Bacteroidales bacterium]|jgi:cystathionine beta-lyase|nr:pyridoxal phosphate-dependent aminotransferase [Bacteroidales bacterium]
MRYDFDEIIPRRDTESVKWDLAAGDVLPMWVADMDFRTAQPVTEALMKRVQHGVFGYTKAFDAYYDAVAGWFGRRHGLNVKREWILPVIGVVPAVSAVLRALTTPGDKVILQSPVYHCFYSVINNNGCKAVSNRLMYDGKSYSVDFDALEQLAADPLVKVFLLCHPHNPAGRVWTKDELMLMGNICRRNGVTVVSDEIHCDLTYGGYRHIPFASLGDEYLLCSVTCTSPSKTFNLAGTQGANLFVADERLKRSIMHTLDANGISEPNAFAVDAVTAAYNEGEEWLEQLLHYLYDNYLFLENFLAEHLPALKALPLQATYLVWIDCSALHRPSRELAQILLRDQKLWINAGAIYGDGGDNFLRINIACPRSLLADGLNRIKNAFAAL